MRDPKVAAGLQHKANQWFKLDQGLQGLQNQGLQDSKDSTLELTANMLQVNPDPLYLWDRRRSMLIDTNTSALDYLKEELTLTQKCLERNPKAYGAWFHRKWCILQQQQSSNDDVVNNNNDDVLLKGEIALTTQFLNLDERNFHCWNYRRFIVGCLCNGGKDGEICVKQKVLFGSQVGGGAAPSTGVKHDDDDDNITIVQSSTALLQSEFEFTTTKIQQNFSNGSAFHYRSKLLPLFVGTNLFSLDDELELAHNAMFTEPDDQTAWWYYDFLLEDYGNEMDLDVEKEMLEELIEVEGGQSKWGLLGLYQVVSRMAGQESRQREILESLKMLDPVRSARYNDMLKSILMIE